MTTRSSLADVALAAGVSRATASRALNGRPEVSEETRQRVEDVAERLGYRPSGTARALRQGTFRAISAIVPDRVWGWWEPVLAVASQAASEAGFHLLVHPIAGTDGGLAAVAEGLAHVPTEGVIVVSVPDQESVRRACDRIDLPVVAIDDTSRGLRMASVSVRNRAGARRLTEHLIAQGCRRIVCVGALTEDAAPHWGDGLFAAERIAGFQEALDAEGPAVTGAVLDWPAPGDESAADVPELAALLAAGPRPDAVFCLADMIAAPVLRTLSAHGLSVPQDLILAGFDDERAALLLNPQLTTMRQPYAALGRAAVDLLLRSVGGEQVPEQRHEFDVELVVRDSTNRGCRPGTGTSAP
jgi:LacI family transcriptional regulator